MKHSAHFPVIAREMSIFIDLHPVLLSPWMIENWASI